MLYMDIYEYLLEWTEKNPSSKNTKLTMIGRKLLVLHMPYNAKQINKKLSEQVYNVNFFPHFKNGDDYFIDGTHLFTND